MAEKKFTNITILITGNTEIVKKNCKQALHSMKVKDQDWDEVKNSNGTLIALTVFIKTVDLATSLSTLAAVSGVGQITVGDSFEPTAVIATPIPNSTVANIITLTAVPTQEAKKQVKRINYIIDDNFIGSATVTPFSVSLDTTSLDNGSHDIQTFTYDAKGKLMGKSTEVTVTTNNVAASEVQTWDGTLASLNAVLATGFGQSPFSAATYTYNLDGTVLIQPTGAFHAMHNSSVGNCASYPDEAVIEFKAALPTTRGSGMGIACTNGAYAFGVNLQNSPQTLTITYEATPGSYTEAYFEPVTPMDTNLHTFRATISSTGLIKGYYDGVEKISVQGAYNPSVGNGIDFFWNVAQTAPLLIDYMSWTINA